MLSGEANASLGSLDVSAPPMVDGSSIVVQLGDGAARRVRYRDADGTGVAVSLRKGWASLELIGDGLQWSLRKGTVHIDGDGVELADILLRDTGPASQLKIKTNKGGDGLSTLGGLSGSSPLGKLKAKRTDLVGDGIVLTGEGTIGAVWLHDVTNGADLVLPSTAGKGVQIFAGSIGEGSDVQVGSAIRKLRVGEWLDDDPEADLVAGRVDRLWVAGDFWADMALSGDSPAGVTLGKVYIGGSRIRSDWSVTGPVGPVVIRGGTFVREGLVLGAPAAPAGDVDQLVAGSNAFAWDLYHTMAENPEAGNLVFSPLSVSMALSMAYAGAAGETASQIAEVARFGLEGDRVGMGMGELIGELDGEQALSVFNGVWAQDMGAVQRRYAELVGHYYGAEMGVVDFQRNPGGARNSINRRVRTLTGGAIPAMFGPGSISKSTTLALASTIGWNGEWDKPFDESETGDWTFTSLDGGRKQISMMSQLEDFGYTDAGSYQAVRMYSQDRSQTMLIILPAEGEFENVQAQLSEDMIRQVYNGLGYDKVDLKIPRFQGRQSADLAAALEALGVSDAFDAGVADFSGIEAGGAGGLSLDTIVHHAAIDLAEEAAKGSTSTSAYGSSYGSAGATMWTAAHVRVEYVVVPPERFIADRPFIYVIRDEATEATVFVGRVTDATGEGFKSNPTGARSPELYEGTRVRRYVPALYGSIGLSLSVNLAVPSTAIGNGDGVLMLSESGQVDVDIANTTTLGANYEWSVWPGVAIVTL